MAQRKTKPNAKKNRDPTSEVAAPRPIRTAYDTEPTPEEEASYHQIIAEATYSFLRERATRADGDAAAPPTMRRGPVKLRIDRPTAIPPPRR